jgi:hypothetical protein
MKKPKMERRKIRNRKVAEWGRKKKITKPIFCRGTFILALFREPSITSQHQLLTDMLVLEWYIERHGKTVCSLTSHSTDTKVYEFGSNVF